MALMGKNQCDYCGDAIALLEERKYLEGNMCKVCEKKLSRWFDNLSQSTRQMVDDHFAYREANRAAVAAFHCTRSLGFGMGESEEIESRRQQHMRRLLLDDDARKFMVRWEGGEDNPDVLDFSQITGCEYRERYSRDEDDHDTYYYLTIYVDSPYFQSVFVSTHDSVSYWNYQAEADLMKEVINDIIREEHPENAEELSPSMLLRRRLTQPLPHPAPQPVPVSMPQQQAPAQPVAYPVPPQQSAAAPPPMPVPMPQMQQPGPMPMPVHPQQPPIPMPMPQSQPVPMPMPQMQQPVQSQPVQPQPTPKFCRQCGNPLAPGAKFCASCGSPIYQ